MTAYNSERFIKEAVESVLAQTYKDFELIIVDDGSTDNTRTIIRSFTDPRIHLIEHPENKGIAGARNTSLKAVRGSYIAILDSDDVTYPKRLEKELYYLETHPYIAVVGSWADVIGDKAYQLKPEVDPELLSWKQLFENMIINSSVLFRKEALPDQFQYQYDPTEDFYLWSVLNQTYLMANIGESLIAYRIHSSSTTRSESIQKKIDANRRAIATVSMAPYLSVSDSEFEILFSGYMQKHPKVSSLKDLQTGWRLSNHLLKSYLQKRSVSKIIEKLLKVDLRKRQRIALKAYLKSYLM